MALLEHMCKRKFTVQQPLQHVQHCRKNRYPSLSWDGGHGRGELKVKYAAATSQHEMLRVFGTLAESEKYF